MPRVDVVSDSSLPPARVYAFLSEHENLGPLLGATVRRVRDGFTSRNGEGSVRELRVAPVLPPVEETVVAAEPDRSIDYRITKGGFPLRGHRGRVELSPLGAGTRVRWTIDFGSPLPGVAALVAAGLSRGIAKGLQSLDAKA